MEANAQLGDLVRVRGSLGTIVALSAQPSTHGISFQYKICLFDGRFCMAKSHEIQIERRRIRPSKEIFYVARPVHC